MQRRHLLLAGAAALAAPAWASRDDRLDPTPFGRNPLLQPLQGWSDGMDRVAEGLRVEGRLPAALQGTLYRNGPGLLACNVCDSTPGAPRPDCAPPSECRQPSAEDPKKSSRDLEAFHLAALRSQLRETLPRFQ